MCMNSQANVVIADGHAHLYPAYDLPIAFRCLIRNLDRLALSAEPATIRNGILKLAFLVEAEGHDFFSRFKNREASVLGNGLEVISVPSALCVAVSLPGVGQVNLIAGRQIATRERLEVLGLAMSAKIPDGLPLDEVIQRVVEAGGVPVLAWSPGKWLFARGRLLRSLLEVNQERRLCLGDTTLRPLFWPEPQLVRLARGRGLQIIPGSDSLPFAGEERYLGTYGFVCRGPFAVAQPAESLRRILAAGIESSGVRCGALTVARRLMTLRAVKAR